MAPPFIDSRAEENDRGRNTFSLQEWYLCRCCTEHTPAVQLKGRKAIVPVHPSTLTSSLLSPRPRCQRGRDLFSRQNVLWVAEMRLILIREPIITLLLLLSLMLTTASPPVCLSLSTTISLCLPAPEPVSPSVCRLLTLPPCEPATCSPALRLPS